MNTYDYSQGHCAFRSQCRRPNLFRNAEQQYTTERAFEGAASPEQSHGVRNHIRPRTAVTYVSASVFCVLNFSMEFTNLNSFGLECFPFFALC